MDYSKIDYSKSIARIDRIVVNNEGWLEKKKKTIKHKDLDKRWCVLSGSVARFYLSQKTTGMADEELQITGTEDWKDKSASVFKQQCAFSIVTNKHTYHCMAPTADDKQKWRKAIDQALTEDKKFAEEVKSSPEASECKGVVESAAKRDEEQLSEALLVLATKSAVSQSVLMDLSYNAIPVLVKLILSSSSKAVENATFLLRSLCAWSQQCRDEIAKEGATKPLISLLTSDSNTVAEQAAACIANMSSSRKLMAELAQAGAIEGLAPLLAKTGKPTLRKNAVVALKNLALDTNNLAAIYAAGVLEPIVNMLFEHDMSNSSTVDPVLLDKACAMIWHFAAADVAGCRKRIGQELGGITPLVELLFKPNANVQMHAAGALACLARDLDNRRSIGDAEGIPPLIKLLETDKSEAAQQQAVSALANLTLNTQSKEEFGGGQKIPVMGVDTDDPAVVAAAKSREEDATRQAEEAAQNGLKKLQGLLDYHLESSRNTAATSFAIQTEASSLIHHICAVPAHKAAVVGKAGEYEHATALMLIIEVLKINTGQLRDLLQSVASGLKTSSSSDRSLKAKAEAKHKMEQAMRTQILQLHVGGAIDLLGEMPQVHTIVREHGALVPMVQLVAHSPMAQVQAKFCSALSRVGRDLENATVISDSHGVPVLITKLKSTEEMVKVEAAGAIATLAAVPDIGEKIAKYGKGNPTANAEALLEVLLEMVQCENVRAQEAALAVLANITLGSMVVKKAAAHMATLKTIISKLSPSSTVAVQENAAALLGNLAHMNPHNQAKMAQAGVLQPLVLILKPVVSERPSGGRKQSRVIQKAGSFGRPKPKGDALRAGEYAMPSQGLQRNVTVCLRNLAEDDDNKAKLHKLGAMELLFKIAKKEIVVFDDLPPEISGVGSQALGALRNLSTGHDANKHKLMELGGIEMCAGLIVNNDNESLQEKAAGIIYNIVTMSTNVILLIGKNEGSEFRFLVENMLKVVKGLEKGAEGELDDGSILLLQTLATLCEIDSSKCAKLLGAHPRVVPLCVEMMAEKSQEGAPHPPSMRTLAARCLAGLACAGDASDIAVMQGKLATSRVLSELAAMLAASGGGDASTWLRSQAAKTLLGLARDNPDNQVAVAKVAGVLDALTGMLDGGCHVKEQMASMELLSVLAMDVDNRKMIDEAGALEQLVLISKDESDASLCGASLSALEMLEYSAPLKEKIAALQKSTAAPKGKKAKRGSLSMTGLRERGASLWGMGKSSGDKKTSGGGATESVQDIYSGNTSGGIGYGSNPMANPMGGSTDPPAAPPRARKQSTMIMSFMGGAAKDADQGKEGAKKPGMMKRMSSAMSIGGLGKK